MPYWRLSAFYFFYFAALGALVPFWGLFLQDEGLDSLAIGQLMAILTGTKVVAPNIWGWIADRRGRRMPVVRLAALLALLVFAGIFLVRGFWGIALVMALFSFFWNASLPQMEAVTFNHLGPRMRRYATIRLWGSIGFILAVLGLGAALERSGTGLVPRVVLVLFVGVWLSSLLIPERAAAPAREDGASVRALLRRPEVVAFLLAGCLMQVSHGAYYAFYSIHLTGAGYSAAAVGALWAWGVSVEVLLFLRMHWLLERFGARQVLLASLALAALRWLLIGSFVDQPLVQVLAQALHAATFGAFHASAVLLAHHYFVGRTQGRGQALYNSLSFGAGGALGALMSGLLWSSAGAPLTFAAASLAAGLGWLTAWRWVDRARRF